MLPNGQVQIRQTCPKCNGRGEVPAPGAVAEATETNDEAHFAFMPCPDCTDGHCYQWMSVRELFTAFAEEFTRQVRQATGHG